MNILTHIIRLLLLALLLPLSALSYTSHLSHLSPSHRRSNNHSDWNRRRIANIRSQKATFLWNNVPTMDDTVQQQIEAYLRARDDSSNQIDQYLHARQNQNVMNGDYTTREVGTYPSQINQYLEARSLMEPEKYGRLENPESEEKENLLQKIKEMGPAGIISYGIVQLVFQGASFVLCLVLFYKATGHWPDFSDPEDAAAFGSGAFAILNVTRLTVPLRMALAFGGATWIQKNALDPLKKKS